jgi:hypothetical protein
VDAPTLGTDTVGRPEVKPDAVVGGVCGAVVVVDLEWLDFELFAVVPVDCPPDAGEPPKPELEPEPEPEEDGSPDTEPSPPAVPPPTVPPEADAPNADSWPLRLRSP